MNEEQQKDIYMRILERVQENKFAKMKEKQMKELIKHLPIVDQTEAVAERK